MANINVRGLPDKTKEALRVRAAQAGMSLEAYARRALTRASMDSIEQPKAIVALSRQYFGGRAGVELELPERSTRRQPIDFS